MATTSEQSDPEADFAAWLTGHRRAILDAIRFYDDESHTSNIREYANVPRGSFNHHIEGLLNPPEKFRAAVDWLGDEGLIEVTGKAEVGKPAKARVFGLTNAGEKAFENVVDDVGIRASDVRDLRERVDELEAQSGGEQGVESDRIEKLERERAANQERIEELEAENKELKECFNHMADVVEGMMGGDDSPSV
ncbi:hypothetical protein [Halococcus thailandensis]|uniref:Uncharacterized protein n=1 Tax=Halococcus thailandensis JCM 13552 TaxID=1227457 RepID=M0NJD1_9EURY|nr:hypothetical protein [Halococcus thailandensis]EMA56790.1 hypothetical protein C451_00250 [Halococcus thailandensis JCM 13552]